MPKRSGIRTQPRAVREQLDKALEREGYGNYEKLAKEFERFGRGFTKSSIHRYGASLERFKQTVMVEREILDSFDETTRYLITWSKSHPKDAARFVEKLRRKALEFMKAHQ